MYIRPEYYKNGIYHVYNRGVAKLPIFRKKSDYFDFREIMYYFLIGFPVMEGSDPSQKSQRLIADDRPVSWRADPNGNGLFRDVIDLLAYCLMPNHFHFLLRIRKMKWEGSDPSHLSQNPVSELMKRIGITYAMKFNRDYDRVGPIFQGRFKIKALDSDELVVHLARYTHINPVIAGLVREPGDWQWSDYLNYQYFNPLKVKSLSKPLFVMEYFHRDPKQYQQFVTDQFTESDSRLIASCAIDSDER